MVTTLAVAVTVLALLVAALVVALVCAGRLIDRLTDKVMARDYADYRAGQAIKAEGDEGAVMPRSDEAEAKIEQENQALLKHVHVLDSMMADTTGVPL